MNKLRYPRDSSGANYDALVYVLVMSRNVFEATPALLQRCLQ